MIQKKILIIIVLILITGLGFAIRYYKLGEAPKGLYIDEAGQGYSAYSILKTGKDEFGKSFPVVFRSFTDFKTPVYVYLVVPLIPFFDLTVFTVRLPSFIFSVLTFPLLYLLLIEMSSNRFGRQETSPSEKKIINRDSLSGNLIAQFGKNISITVLALLATLLLAVSPWHTLFGRTNFECNVALFFYLSGIYLFMIGLNKPWVLILSAIVFAVSLPAYHSERIITPLTVIALFIRYKKILFTRRYLKHLIIGAAAGIIITLPTLFVASTPGFLARASGLNIFSHERQMPSGYQENAAGPLGLIINNPVYLSTKEFLSLYLSYFSPRNMFYLGDYGPRSSFPDLATFYVWQFPFYILGLYFLIKRKDLGDLKFFTFFLLLIAPIPAAVTRDPYTTIRALPMVIPQIIVISLGLLGVMSWLGSRLKLAFTGVFILMMIHSILNLYSSVIVLNEFYRGVEWDYGSEEIAEFMQDKYETVPSVFDNSRDEQYIQMAFFLKYDPVRYQKENFEVTEAEYYTNMNRNTQIKIGKMITRPIEWEKDLATDQFLIGDELAISHQQIKEHRLTLEKEILYPDKSVAFRIVRTNPEYENSKKQKPENTGDSLE